MSKSSILEKNSALMDDEMGAEELSKLAGDFYDKGYKKRGFALYKKAADLGYAKAQHIVAFCYQYGLGTKKDGNEAVRWYQKAIKQEHPQSMCYLANCYAEGYCGLERDIAKAMHLWQKAADLGDKEAQFILEYQSRKTNI